MEKMKLAEGECVVHRRTPSGCDRFKRVRLHVFRLKNGLGDCGEASGARGIQVAPEREAVGLCDGSLPLELSKA